MANLETGKRISSEPPISLQEMEQLHSHWQNLINDYNLLNTVYRGHNRALVIQEYKRAKLPSDAEMQGWINDVYSLLQEIRRGKTPQRKQLEIRIKFHRFERLHRSSQDAIKRARTELQRLFPNIPQPAYRAPATMNDPPPPQMQPQGMFVSPPLPSRPPPSQRPRHSTNMPGHSIPPIPQRISHPNQPAQSSQRPIQQPSLSNAEREELIRLRRENQELGEQYQALEAEMDEKDNKIGEMEEEIKKLKKRKRDENEDEE